MNYCEKYSNLIEDLLAGELDDAAAERTNSHVFACPKCQRRYETLKREKEIYARYLFDAEPPQDLWRNFQARLVAEKEKTPVNADISAASPRPRTNIFGFLRLTPTLAALGAALLCISGIAFVWLKTAPDLKDDNYIAETEKRDSQPTPKAVEIDPQQATALPPDIVEGDKDNARKNGERMVKNQSLKARNNFSAEASKINQKPFSAGERKKPAGAIRLDAEDRRLALRVQNLEKEIAGQIEKIELLLRSFRNAREIGSLETFDVDYEKTQARRLLEKNARLRRDAENYGIFYAEELLSRAEPYLLDIANLENNPPPGKVLDIKERVSNQNIIASLQVYSSAAAVR
jgi:hypothetical protein